MRTLAVGLLLVTMAIVATQSAAASAPATRLSITPWVDGKPVVRQRATLTCHPTGGTHPRPAAACALLDRRGRALFAPVPPDLACTAIYGGPEVIVVAGRLDGRAVWARFRRDDGCQINRWNAAVPLLELSPKAA